MNINSSYLCDGYKLDHRRQYPNNTAMVYSNWTPRKSRVPGSDGVIVFGVQYFLQKYLIEDFTENFFHKPVDEVVTKFTRRINNYLGPNSVGEDHVRALHKLGYLPIAVMSLPEGTLCPIGVPVLTVYNTLSEFFWVTNFLETIMSCVLWKPTTSATTAYLYWKRFMEHAEKTGSPIDAIKWQAHDFSFRGMSGLEDACMSGAGHLTSFTGTDTIPAIDFLEHYYDADSDKELVGGSVAATEHSVMCMGMKDNEYDTFERLINKVYPIGVVSIVSDTWDFWQVMTEYLPKLKDSIMARDGRVVIRPDSGEPVDIICGRKVLDVEHVRDAYYMSEGALDTSDYYVRTKENKYFEFKIEDVYVGGSYYLATLELGKEVSEAEVKGAYQLMWELFGGTTTDKGYKMLDTHIGLIYGDSITLSRQNKILARLEDKGFCASNLVLGVGSYSYEYVTRDTYGFAMKATYGEITEGAEVQAREIFKDPKTDSGFKKSAKGLLEVVKEDGKLVLKDQVDWDDVCAEENEHRLVFCDGSLYNVQTLAEIRARVKSNL